MRKCSYFDIEALVHSHYEAYMRNLKRKILPKEGNE
jgi:hypothetical protein